MRCGGRPWQHWRSCWLPREAEEEPALRVYLAPSALLAADEEEATVELLLPVATLLPLPLPLPLTLTSSPLPAQASALCRCQAIALAAALLRHAAAAEAAAGEGEGGGAGGQLTAREITLPAAAEVPRLRPPFR